MAIWNNSQAGCGGVLTLLAWKRKCLVHLSSMAHDVHILSEIREELFSLDDFFADVENCASIFLTSNGIFSWCQISGSVTY